MEVLSTKGWADYELLDSGNGVRLERFGEVVLIRPDPQCIWMPHLPVEDWQSASAVFHSERGEFGKWEYRREVPPSWVISYQDLRFVMKLTPFKHTGLFPEQHLQWDWIQKKIQKPRVNEVLNVVKDPEKVKSEVSILNLFAYTGGATLAAAMAGAKVTHVDSSKPAVNWARENQAASGLENRSIRWILDDAVKFVEREVKRGSKYDGIILDPPIYGHGPNGETWDLMKDLPRLLEACRIILTDKPLFILINTYSTVTSATMLKNLFTDYLVGPKGRIECGELALEESSGHRQLSAGIFARWQQ